MTRATTVATIATAILVTISASRARAQQVPINVRASSLSGSITSSISCPNSTDTCNLETLSGSVQKTIGGVPSGGILSISLYADLTTGVAAPVSGACTPAQGTGTIKNPAGNNVLAFGVQGWLCTAGQACLVGPLSFSIRNGSGTFLTATGTGTFNAQSPSCFTVPNDVQMTMKGVIIQ